MLGIIAYCYSHRGKTPFRERYNNKNGSKSASNNKRGSRGKHLALYFFVVAFSIVLESRRISRSLRSNNVSHLRIAQLNQVLVLKSGTNVVVVTPTFGTIRCAGRAASFGNISIFCSDLRPNHLLLSINCLPWTKYFHLSTPRSPGMGAQMYRIETCNLMH